MISQMNGYPYGGSGDIVPPPHMFFNHQYPPVMPGYQPHCHWYPPEDAVFYFDGESYVSIDQSEHGCQRRLKPDSARCAPGPVRSLGRDACLPDT